MINAISKRAFSTPELLMTLLVFSFGLLPLIVLFQNSSRTTAQAKNIMVAQTLGRTIVDEIKSRGFNAIHSEVTSPKLDLFHDYKQVTGRMVPSDDNSMEYPAYYGRFKAKVEAQPDVTTAPTRYRIMLTVKWKEPSREHQLAFGTVVSRFGPR